MGLPLTYSPPGRLAGGREIGGVFVRVKPWRAVWRVLIQDPVGRCFSDLAARKLDVFGQSLSRGHLCSWQPTL